MLDFCFSTPFLLFLSCSTILILLQKLAEHDIITNSLYYFKFKCFNEKTYRLAMYNFSHRLIRTRKLLPFITSCYYFADISLFDVLLAVAMKGHFRN